MVFGLLEIVFVLKTTNAEENVRKNLKECGRIYGHAQHQTYMIQ